MISAFDQYGEYANQRAAVAEGGDGWAAEYEGTRAIGFVLSGGAVDPDDVRATLLEAIRPADVVVEDRRVEHDWGASGPILFNLLIGMAGSLSAQMVVSAVQDLLRRARRTEAPSEPRAANAETVSRTFTEFVASALRGKEPKVDQIEQRNGHWYVAGRCSRGEVEGLVSVDGEIVIARLTKPHDEPLIWPA